MLIRFNFHSRIILPFSIIPEVIRVPEAESEVGVLIPPSAALLKVKLKSPLDHPEYGLQMKNLIELNNWGIESFYSNCTPMSETEGESKVKVKIYGK